jgi:hypothetical protein
MHLAIVVSRNLENVRCSDNIRQNGFSGDFVANFDDCYGGQMVYAFYLPVTYDAFQLVMVEHVSLNICWPFQASQFERTSWVYVVD